MKNHQNSTHLKAITSTILVLAILFLMPICSASDWYYGDNMKLYDEAENKITIIDTNIITKDKTLTDYTLKSNTYQCFINCEGRVIQNLRYDDVLLDDIEIIDLDSKNKISLEELNVYIITQEDYLNNEPVYKEVCKDIIDNSSQQINVCSDEITGYKEVTRQREVFTPYEVGTTKTAGTYEISIKGKKGIKQNLDWRINAYGQTLDEWAIWNSSFDAGLQVWWKLNDTGTTATDYLGIYNFTANNWNASGIIDGSLKTNNTGLDTSVLFNNTYSSDGATLSFWVNRFAASADFKRIIGTFSGASNGHWSIHSAAAYDVRVFMYDDAGEKSISTTPSLAANKWEHIVLRFDNVNNNLSLWKNGTHIDSVEFSNGYIATTNTIWLFSDNAGGNPTTYHILDEIGIWNRSLGTTEISDLYNSGSGLTPSPEAPSLDVTVTLDSPADGTNTSNPQNWFSADILVDDGNATNMTFYLFNSSGSTVNSTGNLIANVTGECTQNGVTDETCGTMGSTTWTNIRTVECAGADANATDYYYNMTLPYSFENVTSYVDFGAGGNQSIQNCSQDRILRLRNYDDSGGTPICEKGSSWHCWDGSSWVALTAALSSRESAPLIHWNITDVGSSMTYYLPYDDDFDWNYFGCGINSTDYSCVWGTNRTRTLDTTSPTINVTYPYGNLSFTKSGDTIDLNWTVSDTGVGLDACWYMYGGANTTVTCSDNTTTFTLQDDNMSLIFYSNDTLNNLGSFTRLWDYILYLENEDYNEVVYETDYEKFNATITVPTGSTLYSANLVYNGTSYLVDSTLISGTKWLLERFIDIPILDSDAQKNFYWQVAYLTGTTISIENSSTTQHNVSIIAFNSSNINLAINYSIYNETSRAIINSSFDATFEFYLGNGTVIENYSYDSSADNEFFQFYIHPNETFYTSAKIKLEATGFNERYYDLNIEEYNTTNQEQEFFLTDQGTNVIIEVDDAGRNPAVGYFVEIERYYPETNEYEMVESKETDIYGQFTARLIESDEKYRFTFKNATNYVVKTTGDMTIACRATICVLPFILEDTTDDLEAYDNYTDYDYTLSWNNNTNIFTFSWNDLSTVTVTSRLEVIRRLWNSTSTICNSTSTAKQGVLTCDVGNQSASYQAQVFRRISGQDERRIGEIYARVGTEFRTFGREGLIWATFLLLTMITLGYYKPPIGFVLHLFCMIGLMFIKLIEINPAILISFIVIDGIFIWAFKG